MSEQASNGDRPLERRTIAIPETRQLDTLAALLESRGAAVLRCPLVAILDAPDPEPVVAWLRRAIETPFDLLILYTGEGIERLLGFAERAGLKERFLDTLGKTQKLCRGPKPARALRRLALETDIAAAEPTTEGILETLGGLELAGKRVGVQLYRADGNEALEGYLHERGAEADMVAPYVYASAADDARVAELIGQLCRGDIDAIAFTNKTQVERLQRVAADRGLAAELATGLGRTRIAAVGPVVADELAKAGIVVDAMPEDGYFMKPLVTELARVLGPAAPR
jgi:uroporphyrinogen-III synthase